MRMCRFAHASRCERSSLDRDQEQERDLPMNGLASRPLMRRVTVWAPQELAT
jgi:hypothetical protein